MIFDISSLNQEQLEHLATLKTPKEKKEYIEQFLKKPERVLKNYSFGKETVYDQQNNMQEVKS